MSINELQDGIIEEFEAFDDWIDRYQLIIDYAKELNNHPFPDADRNSRNLIDGCQSPVWFTVRMEDGKMIINGDSDAQLVKGMVALLIHVLSNGMTAVGIAQMARPTEDAGLQMFWIVSLHQHLHIMVGFQNKILGATDETGHLVGDAAGVGNDAEGGIVSLDEIAHIVTTVVRNGEGRDAEVAYLHGFTRRQLVAQLSVHLALHAIVTVDTLVNDFSSIDR